MRVSDIMKAKIPNPWADDIHSVGWRTFRGGFAGLAGVVVALTALVLLSSQALAQTCAAPIQLPLSPARPSMATSTCGQGEPAGLRLCHGTVVTGGPSMVFNLTVGAGNTASLMAVSTDLEPYLYLTGPGCASRSCLQGAGYLSLHDVTPGDYSLVVTSSPIDSNGTCGAVSLVLDGDLAPGDVVFSNSFE
jgi:hypothetical protein